MQPGREAVFAHCLVALAAVLIAGCGETPPAPQIQKVSFAGMTVPGRMDDAKASGFTDCQASHYSYTCRRAVPIEVYGIAAQAELELSGRQNFSPTYVTSKHDGKDVRTLPPEELSYGSIALHFAEAEYSSKCVDRHQAKNGSLERPVACITNKNTAQHFAAALANEGWILARSRRSQDFVHPRQHVEISIRDETATIRWVAGWELQEMLAIDARKRAAEAQSEAGAANVIEKMKQ